MVYLIVLLAVGLLVGAAYVARPRAERVLVPVVVRRTPRRRRY